MHAQWKDSTPNKLICSVRPTFVDQMHAGLTECPLKPTPLKDWVYLLVGHGFWMSFIANKITVMPVLIWFIFNFGISQFLWCSLYWTSCICSWMIRIIRILNVLLLNGVACVYFSPLARCARMILNCKYMLFDLPCSV